MGHLRVCFLRTMVYQCISKGHPAPELHRGPKFTWPKCKPARRLLQYYLNISLSKHHVWQRNLATHVQGEPCYLPLLQRLSTLHPLSLLCPCNLYTYPLPIYPAPSARRDPLLYLTLLVRIPSGHLLVII